MTMQRLKGCLVAKWLKCWTADLDVLARLTCIFLFRVHSALTQQIEKKGYPHVLWSPCSIYD